MLYFSGWRRRSQPGSVTLFRSRLQQPQSSTSLLMRTRRTIQRRSFVAPSAARPPPTAPTTNQGQATSPLTLGQLVAEDDTDGTTSGTRAQLLPGQGKLVVPGRTVLHRLINLTIGFTRPHHHIALPGLTWQHGMSSCLIYGQSFDVTLNVGDCLIHFTSSLIVQELRGVGPSLCFRHTGFMGCSPHPGSVRISHCLNPIVAALSAWGLR